ncbi:MAG: hypothetical protein O3A01_07430 [bacterium]|nr:hypothetical protein [bacterium]
MKIYVYFDKPNNGTFFRRIASRREISAIWTTTHKRMEARVIADYTQLALHLNGILSRFTVPRWEGVLVKALEIPLSITPLNSVFKQFSALLNAATSLPLGSGLKPPRELEARLLNCITVGPTVFDKKANPLGGTALDRKTYKSALFPLVNHVAQLLPILQLINATFKPIKLTGAMNSPQLSRRRAIIDFIGFKKPIKLPETASELRELVVMLHDRLSNSVHVNQFHARFPFSSAQHMQSISSAFQFLEQHWEGLERASSGLDHPAVLRCESFLFSHWQTVLDGISFYNSDRSFIPFKTENPTINTVRLEYHRINRFELDFNFRVYPWNSLGDELMDCSERILGGLLLLPYHQDQN